jgi:uncharacterized protein (UPF0333 family)
MMAAGRKISRIHGDQRGQATLEWALLLVAVVIPSIFLINLLMNVLSVHYQMVTFLQALPFP